MRLFVEKEFGVGILTDYDPISTMWWMEKYLIFKSIPKTTDAFLDSVTASIFVSEEDAQKLRRGTKEQKDKLYRFIHILGDCCKLKK